MAYPLFNIRFILLISASFIAIFSSIAIYFCLPILISHMIRIQITLSPTSGSYNNWRLNSVIDQIYLYNITNLSNLTSESTSVSKPAQPRQIPRLQQIGPFTFRQDREKVNIKFDAANETVIYDQKRKWTFMPELSLAKSIDEMNSLWINHMSVSLAGTTLNPEYGEFIDPIVAENDLRLFVNHSVNALLFEGYWDLLMEQAKASGQVDVDRFGWMYNQNNSISKSIRVFTGPSNATLDKFGSVDQYDHRMRFNVWHDNSSNLADLSNVQCNDFRYSSAGEFFPPPENSLISYNNHHNYNNHQQHQQIKDGLSIEADYNNNREPQSIANQRLLSSSSSKPSAAADDPTESDSTPSNTQSGSGQFKLKRHANKVGKAISMFMPDLCRTIQLYYNGSYYFKDLLVDRYIANEYTYAYPKSSNNNNNNNNGYSDNSSNNKLVEANKCYCTYNETSKSTSCPPNGMMDLFSCRKGSPVTISFPHFLYSTREESLAPILRLFSDDVEANLDEHQFFIDLEATLNVPVNVQIVIQFNVHLRNDQSMNFTKEYSYLFEDPLASSTVDTSGGVEQLKDLYLPQMWIKSTAQIDDTNLKSLKFIQKHLKLVTPITTIIIFCFASILLMASAKLAYDLTYGPNSSRKSISCDHESCSCLDDGDHNQCSYLDAKKKSFGMQLLASEKSSAHNHQILNHLSSSACTKSMSSGGASDCMKFIGHDTQDTNQVYPSTSKKANNYVIQTSSLRNGRVDCVESEPLNR